MPLEVKGMTRSFKFKKGTEYVTLADPGTDFTPDMVMSYYSNMYPELTTATVHGPVIREDMAEYEFKTTIGTKGKGKWERTTLKRRKNVSHWTNSSRNSFQGLS